MEVLIMFMARVKCGYVGIGFFLLLSINSTTVAAQPEGSYRPTISDTVRPVIEKNRFRPLIASWWPPIFSLSCKPKPQGVFDIYDEARAKELLHDKNISVLVGHGIAKIGDTPGILLSIEHVPVFISARRELNNLSSEQLAAILKGRITDWKDLGSKEGRIKIYLHKGTLQKKSFEKFSELSLGIKPEDFPRDRIVYAESYEKLESVAAQDDSALVIGLRKLKPENLKTISIDRVSFSDDSYPLTLPVYLYKRDTPQANDLSLKFVESMSKDVLKNRIIKYPANIR